MSAMSLDTPYRSPSDAFAAAAARRPDAPFLLAPASAGLPYAPEGFKIEYGAFKTEVDRLRAEYAAAGYGRGARARPPDRYRQPHSAVPDGRRRAECRIQ